MITGVLFTKQCEIFVCAVLPNRFHYPQYEVRVLQVVCVSDRLVGEHKVRRHKERHPRFVRKHHSPLDTMFPLTSDQSQRTSCRNWLKVVPIVSYIPTVGEHRCSVEVGKRCTHENSFREQVTLWGDGPASEDVACDRHLIVSCLVLPQYSGRWCLLMISDGQIVPGLML